MINNVNFYDIIDLYEKELCKSIKNKKSLIKFEYYKFNNLSIICDILKTNNYNGGHYNIFLINDPKYRIVMSLNVVDKIINHYVSKFYLMPNLEYRLDDRNIATRKGKGTDYGIKLVKKYIEQMKKYKEFYILKLDIKKHFYNIDHDILKSMLKPYLKDYEYNITSKIIDSTNEDYVNLYINKLKYNELKKVKVRREEIENIPIYKYNKGLPIGNLTSQFLAIYYLNGLDHYIIHNLKLKRYVRYMDDFIIMSENKEYLKECKNKIIEFLNNKLKLEVNKKKTYITSSKEGFCFLGYKYRVIDNKTIITLCSGTKKRIKEKLKYDKYLINKNKDNFEKVFCSVNNYLYSFKYGSKLWIKRNVYNYFFK